MAKTRVTFSAILNADDTKEVMQKVFTAIETVPGVVAANFTSFYEIDEKSFYEIDEEKK